MVVAPQLAISHERQSSACAGLMSAGGRPASIAVGASTLTTAPSTDGLFASLVRASMAVPPSRLITPSGPLGPPLPPPPPPLCPTWPGPP